MRTLQAFLSVLLLAWSSVALATVRVHVQALFKDRAMLQINGTTKLLRTGEIGPHGVRLIAANSKFAEVEVNGVKRRLTVSGGVHSNFSAPEQETISIVADAGGAYHVDGQVNGQTVRFLVDTGASAVALNGNVARRLGIDYQRIGSQQQVGTASGTTTGFAITLDRVQIGTIELRNVGAMIIDGDYPKTALLGMTFLREVEIREKGGLLELRY